MSVPKQTRKPLFRPFFQNFSDSSSIPYRIFLIFVISLILQFCDCQVNIEVYDSELFLKKTNGSVYNPNVFPYVKKKPLVVNVSIQLDRWGPYDETKSEFSAGLQVHLKWFDDRLAMSETPPVPSPNMTTPAPVRHFEADQIHLLQIWRPSIYFSNANSLLPDLLSDKSTGQIMGKIGANGRVQIVKRASITANCKVNIKLYPVDILMCSIELQSTSSEQQLRLAWDAKPVFFTDDYNWGVFDLITFQNNSHQQHYDVVGPFTRLEVNFSLRRKLGYFLIDVYLPSALFVISSWASFWIDIPAAPARVALVLTTMLTHVTSTKSIHDKHPRVAYIHSLDVWVMVCSMFIFAALIEYATANYFYHKRDRMKDKKLENVSTGSLKESKTHFTTPTIEINNNSIDKIEEMSIDNINNNLKDHLSQMSHINNLSHRRNIQKSLFHRRRSLPGPRLSPEYLSPEYSGNDDDSDVPHTPTLLKRAWRSMLSLVVPPFEHDIETRRTALEIDRKSRIIFPIAFILFNVVYWSILLVLSFTNHTEII